MNSLYFFTAVYSLLKNRSFIPNRLMTPIRYIIRVMADIILSYRLESIRPHVKMSIPNMVVSLTSFPERIGSVWKVVKCLKCQECRPEKIILWLSKLQFSSEESIPVNLRKQEDDLFEIRFVDGDIRSHKKYYYAMKEFPESTIVTVDDDIYYHPKTITYLINSSQKYPHSIISNITIRIKYDGEKLLSTRKWKGIVPGHETRNLVQIGAGGVLYPPHCLDKIVFDMDALSECAPFADDLWLNMSSRVANTPVIQSDSDIQFLLFNSAPSALYKSNVHGGGNDIQLNRIRKYMVEHKGYDPYAFQYVVDYPKSV